MKYGAKRSLEEIINMSDSDDEDWSASNERPASRRGGPKSKKSPQKKRPAKKRRGNAGDFISDDEEFATDDTDLSIEESSEEEEEEDPNVPKNARGIARRRTTQNAPMYQEPASDVEEIDEAPPKKKQKTLVKLKLDPEILARPDLLTTRRTTRHNRDPSEDIFALTNSGRHMQTVQRGLTPAQKSPSPEISRRGARAVSRPIEQPPSEIQASLEVLESDAPAEGDTVITQSITQEQVGVEMTIDEGVVPESENGEAKNEEDAEYDEDDDEDGPTLRRPTRPNRGAPADDDADYEPEKTPEKPKTTQTGFKKLPKSSQRKDDDDGDFQPEEDSNDDSTSSEEDSAAGSPQKDDNGSTVSGRPNLRARASQSRGQSEVAEVADELFELKDGQVTKKKRAAPAAPAAPGASKKNPPRAANMPGRNYSVWRQLLQAGEGQEEQTEEPAGSPARRGRVGAAGGKWERTLLPTTGPFGGGTELPLGDSGIPAVAGGVDSDSSDDETIPQPKNLGSTPGRLAGQRNDPQLAGTPANFGKLKDKQALADADPLGVDMNVNFDSVGGLQGHIDQLKEMVSLPLLYPEVFQRFHIVPPRGVLFHGPPGTGKTLLARALANSVSSEGRKVSFYMRKGADTLSKWVGEAERQLRLLFEEARKNQPSIIFFDEIDGLAPVRSSKQDQIHSSIVSTLLALMDGMDGRGQVVVIGATNRPDSVDPALRRPGRFDREFYFPLPNTEGRRAILDIHTKGWDPALPDHVKDELAKVTKGYGGSDLRALCTEAALNSVQRKYPQIYKSDKKLLIDPKKIDVLPKDFMIAVKKMVPSSERSTSSGASALPHNVEPLLRQSLTDVQKALSEIIPLRKNLTALEEAMYEEPDDGDGFRREQMIQDFDRARVFRPRMLLRGPQGMGQQYLAAALMHNFDGLHVQSFDLPTLLSDSTRSPEATVVQLFAEVKRHRPSVIYIPNIQTWCSTVGPTVISTFLSLLRSIPPSDPVLLLGVLEVTGDDDMDDGLLRQMFGFSKKNVFDLSVPGSDARREFFKTLVEYIKTAPSDFPDPQKRKKRKLEELEVAPPPAPAAEAPMTKEELRAQKQKDHQTLNFLKIRIQPIMDQIKKYRKWRTGIVDEAHLKYLFENEAPNPEYQNLSREEQLALRPYELDKDKKGITGLREIATGRFFYNMDTTIIEKRLSNGYYKRPCDFTADIKRVWKDARQHGDPERIMRANELLANVEVDIYTLEQSDPSLVADCEAVYQRELARAKQATERADNAERERKRQRTEECAANASSGNASSGNASIGNASLGHASLGNASLGNASLGHASLGNASSGNASSGNAFSGNTSSGNTGSGAWAHGAASNSARPFTPTRPQNVSFSNGHHNGGSADLNDHHENTQSPHVSRHEYPDLSQYPDRVSQEENLPDTQQGSSSQPSPRPRDSLASNQTELEHSTQQGSQSQSQSQPKPQPPLFGDASRPSNHPSVNLQSLLLEEPNPEIILDHAYIEHLHGELTRQTSGCSVEQLEQINTQLMDYVWHMRGEWNRTAVAKGVTETFNEVLVDMQDMQAIASMSHENARRDNT